MTLREHRVNIIRESIPQVADRASVSTSTISMLERGASPKPSMFKKIAKGYRLSLDRFEQLLRGESQ
jgi:transcriptional regulator with XRE-family HTH domain